MILQFYTIFIAMLMIQHGIHSFILSYDKNNRKFPSLTKKYLLRMSTRVDITTYNVLSSHLASPDWFTSCKPDDLNASNRLNRLKAKLLPKIKQNSIICLQEVSMNWTCDLHAHFSKHGYYFISTLYGNKFNNYMGVGIAVPLAVYDIVQVDIKRIADTIPMTMPKPEKLSFWKSWFYSLFGMTKRKNDGNALDPWYQSLDRKNQMVSVILQPKQEAGNEFVVGTYHMPCMFQLPAVMMIHCIASTRNIQNFAGNRPYVFCGDFNIKPTSSMYKLLTTGSVDTECPDLPLSAVGLSDKWKNKVTPMTSAYAAILGKEPDYTNHAKVKEDPAFIDCLDYIYLSANNWIVENVLELPTLSEGLQLGPLPIKDEPSDHLMLSAALAIKK